jgi:hypothetical protein
MSDNNGQQSCPGCGRVFVCGARAGTERCWCSDLPALARPPEAGKGCYCPDCLKALRAAEGRLDDFQTSAECNPFP